MKSRYTAIIRKSKMSYVALCLELNVSACGDTLPEVEKNLKESIELYLEDIQCNKDTVVESIKIDDFIEFLNDTEPESNLSFSDKFIFKPYELNEIVNYA
jgi:predicted RNase H-like HicB family nuclease